LSGDDVRALYLCAHIAGLLSGNRGAYLDAIVICYRLVLYTYDWHEWEETYAVSFIRKKLRDELKGMDGLYTDRPLIEEEQHAEYARREEAHWLIEEIKFLS